MLSRLPIASHIGAESGAGDKEKEYVRILKDIFPLFRYLFPDESERVIPDKVWDNPADRVGKQHFTIFEFMNLGMEYWKFWRSNIAYPPSHRW